MAFGLGKVVKSGTTLNFTYTCTPLFPSNDDAAELPHFSFVEQIRPARGEVPLIRQAVAVNAAIGVLESGFQDDRDPNF